MADEGGGSLSDYEKMRLARMAENETTMMLWKANKRS